MDIPTMSLKNQMLKDIDKRNSTVDFMPVQRLYESVQSVMPARSTPKLFVIFILIVVISASIAIRYKLMKPDNKSAANTSQVIATAVPISVEAAPPEASLQAIVYTAPAVMDAATKPPIVENKSLHLVLEYHLGELTQD